MLHDIGEIVGEHGLRKLPKTIYGKIVFYADKRVKEDKIVSLQERAEYIERKYELAKDKASEIIEFARKIERELGIDGNKIK